MTASGTVWWNELRTPDEKGAQAFYTELFGWQTFQLDATDASKPAKDNAQTYTVWMSGWKQVGGMLGAEPDAGSEKPASTKACWVPFIAVEDVDQCASRACLLGGAVVEDPFDIPNSGRFALLRDPQGAVFGIARPLDVD